MIFGQFYRNGLGPVANSVYSPGMGRKIQMVFSFFALGMLALFILHVATGQWSVVNWGMLGVSAAVCLLVFINFVYIFTYSYALAAVINASLIFFTLPSAASGLLALVAVMYGVRLALFTRSRNHSASYADKVSDIEKGHDAMPLGVKISLWFMCTWLQTFHLMGIYYTARQAELTTAVMAGAVLMGLGFIIEAVSDAQKQRVKNAPADRFVADGLFRRIRHPNFLGEIMVQAGLITAGAASIAAWNELAAVVLAPGYIILLMITEALRVDKVQRIRYGAEDTYQQWRRRTGTLLPRP